MLHLRLGDMQHRVPLEAVYEKLQYWATEAVEDAESIVSNWDADEPVERDHLKRSLRESFMRIPHEVVLELLWEYEK